MGLFHTQSSSLPGVVLRIRQDKILFLSFSKHITQVEQGSLQWGDPPNTVEVTGGRYAQMKLPQHWAQKATVFELDVNGVQPHHLYAMRKNEQLATALLFDGEDRLSAALKDIHFPYNTLMSVGSAPDTSTEFLDRKIAMPVYIVGMTGGSTETDQLNSLLARTAAKVGIPLGVGSQRWILENGKEVPLKKSYELPDEIPLIGNLGVSEVLSYGSASLKKLHALTGVDAIAIHLNIFQELMQWEGQRVFTDTMKRLSDAISESPVPIILKETGCGFSPEMLEEVMKWKLYAVELTSTAGTQWTYLEALRSDQAFDRVLAQEFSGLGHDAKSQIELIRRHATTRPNAGPKLIASGGVVLSQHVAKLIYAGADMCSVGRGVLRVLYEYDGQDQDGQVDGARKYFEYIQKGLRLAMTLTQASSLTEFKGLWK